MCFLGFSGCFPASAGVYIASAGVYLASAAGVFPPLEATAGARTC